MTDGRAWVFAGQCGVKIWKGLVAVSTNCYRHRKTRCDVNDCIIHVHRKHDFLRLASVVDVFHNVQTLEFVVAFLCTKNLIKVY